MKRLILAAFAVLSMCPVMAQDKVEAHLGADFVSSYLWRGQEYAGVSVQPMTSLEWKGFNVGAWGSFAIAPQKKFSETQEELDLNLGYSIGGFNIGVVDYFTFGGTPFFRYGNRYQSNHTFEANVGYDFGFLNVNWSTNFAGCDGDTMDGKRAYSSYLQLDAPFTLGKIDWTASLGIVPYRAEYYYQDISSGFHINQVALRGDYSIKFPHFELPIFAQLMANPSSQHFFYCFGFTLKAL